MVGSGAPRARRRSARGRRSPGRPAVSGARVEVVEEIGSTNAELAPGRGARTAPRGHRPRRRAPGGRAGPARPRLDLAAAGRAHRLLPAPPRRPRRPPRLAPAADRGRAGRVGRRGHRRAAVAQVAQRPARRATAASWPGSSPRRRLPPARPRSSSGVGLNVSTTAEELPDTGTSLSRVTGATVDRGAGPARASSARSSSATGAGPSTSATRSPPAWPRTTSPGRSTVGHDRRRRPARRLDPRGRRGGGRLGRPARRRHGRRAGRSWPPATSDTCTSTRHRGGMTRRRAGCVILFACPIRTSCSPRTRRSSATCIRTG